MSALLAALLTNVGIAPAMVVIDEAATVREEAPPHGAIGMSTAYRISDAVPAPRSFEFRKRALHVGAAIGIHTIGHDEVYYVRSEEHTSELQSLMRISYAVFCLKKQTQSHSHPYRKRRDGTLT